eukprot:TRINITY_DN14740_c0_g1_i2.p1 TRINITY_DN14740_c0_g1~~TRINITY_DN14740_c0_g1_i2.p1  ORF type:complete len:423 (-),score=82.51 TRINITY_DN14740_c0_g1_i2:478-1746(-)
MGNACGRHPALMERGAAAYVDSTLRVLDSDEDSDTEQPTNVEAFDWKEAEEVQARLIRFFRDWEVEEGVCPDGTLEDAVQDFSDFDWELEKTQPVKPAVEAKPKPNPSSGQTPCGGAATGDAKPAKLSTRKPNAKSKTQKQIVRKLTPAEKEVQLRRERLKQKLNTERAERERREKDWEENKEMYREMARDFMNQVGDFAPNKTRKSLQALPIKMPTPADRDNTRILMLEPFRVQYNAIKANRERYGALDCPGASSVTNQYTSSEIKGLTLSNGAHQPMARPEKVDLPKDFRKPLGTVSLEELNKYDCKNQRILVCVYGEIFDVSDRPDKYDADGPYWFMAGHDLTWGFAAGRDGPEMIDKCFDYWKVAPESLRDSKLRILYGWVAWYEFEYGPPVGKLDPYLKEAGLKGPPMEESEDCCIM